MITGNSGSNVLDGGYGADLMIGGNGNDRYIVFDFGDVVVEGSGLDSGTDMVTSIVSYTLGANLENLALSGTGPINGTGNDANNLITGNGSSNVLDGGLGVDLLIGGAGNDDYIIDDASEINQATQDAGYDSVRSSVTYTLGAQQENLLLTGTATIDGIGNGGDNTIYGNAANNTLDGSAGNDWLIGGTGNDTLVGGAGDDTYLVESVGDVVVEGSGLNSGIDIVYSLTSYVLGANIENLRLFASAAIDGIGNSGNNVITGNVYDNLIDGGFGADTLQAGDGNDTVVYDATDGVIDGGAGIDLLTLTGPAQVLDLVTGSNLAGFESIDLNNGGYTLQVSAAAVVALSDTDTVTVDGGATDTVTAQGAWTHVDDTDGYARYSQGLATLEVALAINRAGISADAAPVNTVPGSQTTNEDTNLVFSTANGNALSVSDGENDMLSVTLAATHGVLTLAQTTNLTSLAGNGTGVISFTGLASDINAALNGLNYQSALDYNGAAQVTLSTSDAQLTDTDAVAISVTPVNDAPAVTDFGGMIFTRTDAPSVLIDTTITLSDVDSRSLVTATLTIGQFQIYDRLNFTEHNDIVGSFDTNTGQLILSGAATLADYEMVIKSVTFETSSIFGGDRSITLLMNDGLLFSVAEGMTISSDLHLEPANLNGSNGFVLYGADTGDQSGFSVSEAGDVNGDGFGDLLIGATYADGSGNGKLGAGETYVVFGKASGFNAEFYLSMLDGSNGFVLDGVHAQDYSGSSVSAAGDVNGDGFGDLLIGTSSTVESYVVFGRADFMPLLDPMSRLDLASLDGSKGFTLDGVDGSDRTGYSVSAAGDVNGDGFGDLIVGAPSGDAAGNLKLFAGESYVVFGQAGGFGPRLDLSSLDNIANSDGSKGFVMYGLDANDRSGFSVSAGGDVNGDGISDLVIGAPLSGSAGNATPQAGESYVVFGKTSAFGQPSGFGPRFDLSTLDGTNGFVMYGADVDDQSGHSVSGAGDVNGDGFADLLIGAHRGAGLGNGNFLAGETYVVFGTDSVVTSSLDLASLDGSNGFVVDGIDSGDYSGSSVSAAGDINGDGFGDLLIGAPSGDPGFARGNPVDVGGSKLYAGETYVLFGKASGFTARLDLFSFDGFVLDGTDAGDFSGRSVSAAGDVNRDGFADLLIGAPLGDAAGNTKLDAGETYVFFGRNFNQAATTDDAPSGTAGNDFLVGGLGNDTLDGGAGIDVLIGGGGNDVLIYDGRDRRVDGGSGIDTMRLASLDQALDLHALGLAGHAFTDLETLDLSGNGDNAVNLTVLDVLTLSTTSNSLHIIGDVGDSLTSLGEGWALAAGGPIEVGGALYNNYTHGAAQLLVDTDLTQTQIT